jgi:DNA-binding LytR/AlgR family response regulator
MPTALIAEDEPLLAQAMALELAAAWPGLHLLPLAMDGEEALQRALCERPDLLFLDIRMPGRPGLEVAQALVEDWSAPQPLPLIVFVTAYDQYAVQAFETCAVDYLLKPVQPARLLACCQRLQARLRERGATARDDDLAMRLQQLLASRPSASRLSLIPASRGNTVHMVPIEDVLMLEAADKYVRVLTADQEHLIRTSLRELLPQLDPEVFWQVHRGTVVRASEIEAATRDETGRISLALRTRPERPVVSRLYAARFKAL